MPAPAAGQWPSGRSRSIIGLFFVKQKAPMFAERNLTSFQGLLYAIWTDKYLSATFVSVNNSDHIRLNADAARRFEPVEARDWSDADLEAARQACPNHLDFAKLLPEVERRLL